MQILRFAGGEYRELLDVGRPKLFLIHRLVTRVDLYGGNDPVHAKLNLIAGSQPGGADALAVDQCAVGALIVSDIEPVRPGFDKAVLLRRNAFRKRIEPNAACIAAADGQKAPFELECSARERAVGDRQVEFHTAIKKKKSPIHP